MARKLGFLILAAAALAVLTINQVRASHDSECAKYVKELLMPECPISKEGAEKPPSKNCCDDILAVDMYCVCRNVPDDVRDEISCRKLVDVAARCDKPLQPGTQCGDYNVPPEA